MLTCKDVFKCGQTNGVFLFRAHNATLNKIVRSTLDEIREIEVAGELTVTNEQKVGRELEVIGELEVTRELKVKTEQEGIRDQEVIRELYVEGELGVTRELKVVRAYKVTREI